jgi:hypothetical protein
MARAAFGPPGGRRPDGIHVLFFEDELRQEERRRTEGPTDRLKGHVRRASVRPCTEPADGDPENCATTCATGWPENGGYQQVVGATRRQEAAATTWRIPL